MTVALYRYDVPLMETVSVFHVYVTQKDLERLIDSKRALE